MKTDHDDSAGRGDSAERGGSADRGGSERGGSAEHSESDSDQIAFGEELADGKHEIVRRRGGDLELGILAPVQEGRPLPPGAELVMVSTKGKGGWFDTKTVYKSGPAQVATPAYRDGYDRIFGKKRATVEA